MLCPNCKVQISDQSKFCVHCGAKIEMVEKAAPATAGSETRKCVKCGAVLRQGATFCSQCGTNQLTAGISGSEATVMMQSAPVPAAAQPAPAAAQPVPAPAQPVPAPAQPVPAPAQPAPIKKKKKKSKWPLVLVIIFFSVVILAVGGYFVLDKVFDINVLELITGAGNEEDDETDDKDDMDDDSEDEEDGSSSNDKEEGNDPLASEESSEPEDVKGDPALLNAVDALVSEASASYANMDYANAISQATNAIDQYVTIAEENQLTEEARSKISDAYDVAATAAIQSAQNIERQEAGPAAYEQIINTIDPVVEMAESLRQKGYEVDKVILEEYNAGLVNRLRDKYIAYINEITTREQWSRDEAWTYADRAHSTQKNGQLVLYDENDLDDPLRLRYVYCLARISQKRCENGIADGSMTTEQAYDAMVALLQETDYNLLILQDIIDYGKKCGKDVTKYQNAYDAIVDYLKQEQNLSVLNSGVNSATVVDIKKFWYFNDLDGDDAYKVDIHNGTTRATREWIRTNIPAYIQ